MVHPYMVLFPVLQASDFFSPGIVNCDIRMHIINFGPILRNNCSLHPNMDDVCTVSHRHTTLTHDTKPTHHNLLRLKYQLFTSIVASCVHHGALRRPFAMEKMAAETLGVPGTTTKQWLQRLLSGVELEPGTW